MITVLGPIIVLGLITGLALLGPSPATAAIINVACSDSDLRAKMLAANNTDTLVIPAGYASAPSDVARRASATATMSERPRVLRSTTVPVTAYTTNGGIDGTSSV
ncbi:MAG: hypothetical protein ACREMB_19050 [Candidatus Rokuibacteriota bacterium]